MALKGSSNGLSSCRASEELRKVLRSKGVSSQHEAVYENWLQSVGTSALANGEIRVNSAVDSFEHRVQIESNQAAGTIKMFLEQFDGLSPDVLMRSLNRFQQLVQECPEVDRFYFWIVFRHVGGRQPTIDSGYEIHCCDKWHFPTSMDSVERFLPPTDDAENALKQAYSENAWVCRALGASILPLADPVHRFYVSPSNPGVGLVQAFGFFHKLGFEKPPQARVKILAGSKATKFGMVMEFGSRGIGRLGLELVECQKTDTYTDLPQEIFGSFILFVVSVFDETMFEDAISDLNSEVKALDYNAIGHGYCVNYHLKTNPNILRKDTFAQKEERA